MPRKAAAKPPKPVETDSDDEAPEEQTLTAGRAGALERQREARDVTREARARERESRRKKNEARQQAAKERKAKAKEVDGEAPAAADEDGGEEAAAGGRPTAKQQQQQQVIEQSRLQDLLPESVLSSLAARARAQPAGTSGQQLQQQQQAGGDKRRAGEASAQQQQQARDAKRRRKLATAEIRKGPVVLQVLDDGGRPRRRQPAEGAVRFLRDALFGDRHKRSLDMLVPAAQARFAPSFTFKLKK